MFHGDAVKQKKKQKVILLGNRCKIIKVIHESDPSEHIHKKEILPRKPKPCIFVYHHYTLSSLLAEFYKSKVKPRLQFS